MNTAPTPILELRNVSKSYGSVQALRGVSLAIRAGEVLGLLGNNGAGKSTLIKLVAGVLRPDSGEVLSGGHPVSFRNPRDAQAAGIATVFQDLALVEVLDVARNVFLGRELTGPLGFVRQRKMRAESTLLFQSLKIQLPSVRAPVLMLSGGQRQGVAIGRAVHQGGRLFVLDEPTAALGVRESSRVIDLIRELRERGSGVLVVSHNIEQLYDLADRFHVLRLGRTVGERMRQDTTREELVSLLTGARAA